MLGVYCSLLRKAYISFNLCKAYIDALMMEAIRSSETSVLTKTTRRNFIEDGIIHSHRLENLKSYKVYLEEWCLLGCYAVWLL
jgi:hypothetical protein